MARRIHFGLPGRPQERAARLGEHCGVRRLPARIGSEILARAELGRVDEDRRCDMRRLPLRLGDQRHMAGMERAHGRHQGDAAAAAAKPRHRFAQRLDLTDDLHRPDASDRACPEGHCGAGPAISRGGA